MSLHAFMFTSTNNNLFLPGIIGQYGVDGSDTLKLSCRFFPLTIGHSVGVNFQGNLTKKKCVYIYSLTAYSGRHRVEGINLFT